MFRRIALVLVVVSVLAGEAVAATPQIRVKPASVYPGEVVRAFGSAEGCPSGDQVTLISKAFSPKHEFAGVPAIFATVKPDGSFSKRTRIPSGRHSGRYRISGRCGGGNLGVTARLRVRAERRCDNTGGAVAIRTRRTSCSRARRLASRYVRDPARRIGRWRCKAHAQRVRCSQGSKRVRFRTATG